MSKMRTVTAKIPEPLAERVDAAVAAMPEPNKSAFINEALVAKLDGFGSADQALRELVHMERVRSRVLEACRQHASRVSDAGVHVATLLPWFQPGDVQVFDTVCRELEDQGHLVVHRFVAGQGSTLEQETARKLGVAHGQQYPSELRLRWV